DSYPMPVSVTLPADLIGAYYVFVITDPARTNAQGKVFEGANERNNDRPSAVPLVIELPPPSDLQVTAVVVPKSATTGELVEVTWTVTNKSNQPATGRWSDSAFFSPDAAWDYTDRAIGRMEFIGTLAPGESYSRTLRARVPSLTPGSYRVIVRTDVFNQVYENVNDANNNFTSADAVDVT